MLEQDFYSLIFVVNMALLLVLVISILGRLSMFLAYLEVFKVSSTSIYHFALHPFRDFLAGSLTPVHIVWTFRLSLKP